MNRRAFSIVIYRGLFTFFLLCGILPALAEADSDAISTTISTEVIAHSGVSTNIMWNAHLPRFTSDGKWAYFMLTNMADAAGNTYRSSFLYKKKLPDGEWTYGGLALANVHQPVALVMDLSNRLHVAFDCLSGPACWTGGVQANGLGSRFFDLIFTKKKDDGSVTLNSGVQNFNEFASWESGGYMGLSTDPNQDRTFASVATTASSQNMFRLGTSSPGWKSIPRMSGTNTKALYPQILFGPDGSQYHAQSEIISGWAGVSFLAYSHVGIQKIVNGSAQKIFSDSVSSPNGRTRWTFYSDSSFGPDGSLYFLYLKHNDEAEGDSCSFLVKISSDGTASSPRPAGCHGLYAQLQVDSRGKLFIFETSRSSTDLHLSQSSDDGFTWSDSTLPLPGLPASVKGLQNASLVKPWTSPATYHPDFIQLVVGGGAVGAYSNYAILVQAALVQDDVPGPSPSPTPTASPTSTPTSTPSPSSSPTIAPSATPSPVASGFRVLVKPVIIGKASTKKPTRFSFSAIVVNDTLKGRVVPFRVSLDGGAAQRISLRAHQRRNLRLQKSIPGPGLYSTSLSVTGPSGTITLPVTLRIFPR